MSLYTVDASERPMTWVASAWVQGLAFFVVYVGVTIVASGVREGWSTATDGLGVTLLIGAAGGVGFGLIVDRLVGRREALEQESDDEL